MKTIFILFLLIISSISGFSQCSINPYIQNNYEVDAKVLALREILNNPSDPDYDNPFVPLERYTPYLERLSAIYENPYNSPMVDSLFNEYKFHVNVEYTFQTPSKKIIFGVDNNVNWIEDFKNTGISGVSELDDLMALYQFSISSFIVLPSAGVTYFYIITSFDFLNVTALTDDFASVRDINLAGAYVDIDERFNYTGNIPYAVENWIIEVCDIWVENDTFTFVLMGDDCPSGCQETEFRYAYVTDDYEVLSTSENELFKFSIFPNPVKDKLFLSSNSLEIHAIQIYSTQGKLIKTAEGNFTEIDVSQLKAGMYFVEINNSEGNKSIQKFIKN